MVYRVIGLMSGSSLDGLDIAFVELQEHAGKWAYDIKAADCYVYTDEWISKLKNSTKLNALDYQLLHTAYGQYIGEQVNNFIEEKNLQYQVALIASHGHTTFHIPSKKMTAQLGDGAAIAAVTRLPVVTDLRAMDVALGGQGAPIVPIGEKLLLGGYDYFLNLGGIANISFRPHPKPLSEREGLSETLKEKHLLFSESSSPPSSFGEGGREDEVFIAFDVCPANRVLNLLANETGKEYDDAGKIAASGKVSIQLLDKLNKLDYYKLPFPKSLANDFGTDIVYPLIRDSGLEIRDSLATYVEHIAFQVKKSIHYSPLTTHHSRLLATGGGAFNNFLIERLKENLDELKIEVVIPDKNLVNYKEALIMALIGVLRWRQENNVLSSVTGASRDSIGGALWNGQEA